MLDMGLATIGSALIGGLGSFIGGERRNSAQEAAAQRQMDFQAQQTQAQMDFQERMSNTAYQRTVADMRAAGINPMLAYQQGGASTPAGGAAVGAQAQLEDTISPAVRSAMQGAEMVASLNESAARTSREKTQAELNVAATAYNAAKTAEATENTALVKAMTAHEADKQAVTRQQPAQVNASTAQANAAAALARQQRYHVDQQTMTEAAETERRRHAARGEYWRSRSAEYDYQHDVEFGRGRLGRELGSGLSGARALGGALEQWVR